MDSLPEDCGGTYGYEELLEIINDPKNERYEEMRDWLENGYSDCHDDRTFVDLDEINMNLKEYKDHAEFLLEDE